MTDMTSANFGRYPARRVGISDGNDRIAEIDSATWALATINYLHHKIHEGDFYSVVYSILAGDTDNFEIFMQTPDTTKWSHMAVTFETALASTFEVWVATTKTYVSGNAITPSNRNGNSSNTSGMTFCHTPAGAQAGDANFILYSGSAATPAGTGGSQGSGGDRRERILTQNTAYLIKLTSRSEGNAMSMFFDWYEHTNEV